MSIGNLGTGFVLCNMNSVLKHRKMKKLIITSILVGLIIAGTTIKAQDQNSAKLGLPGDNLNLYAVMRLFQESKTLEQFEKDLNDPDKHINNLDLNDDNMIDYIRVIDNVDGNVHNIVLRDALNEKESQDVAVFTVQRSSNGKVTIQLTGDEALYGKNYIIEPVMDNATAEQTPNPGYIGNVQKVEVVRTTVVEVNSWPVVNYIYTPDYVVWNSSWYWGYYPTYWHPWQPYSWDYYDGYHYNMYNDYYGHYQRCEQHSYSQWDNYYYNNRREHSDIVNRRINDGAYKTTYSHPEQRQEGVAMYTKLNGNQPVRRADQQSNQNSNVTRRSENKSTNQVISDPATRQNTTPVRRNESGVSKRSVYEQPATVRNIAKQRPVTQSVPTKAHSADRRSSASAKSPAPTKREAAPKKSVSKKEDKSSRR
jgi:hypothetical protein